MMDLQVWKQRQKEMMQEVRQRRLAKTLRNSRMQGGAGRASVLTWELKRYAGRLLKFLKATRKAG